MWDMAFFCNRELSELARRGTPGMHHASAYFVHTYLMQSPIWLLARHTYRLSKTTCCDIPRYLSTAKVPGHPTCLPTVARTVVSTVPLLT